VGPGLRRDDETGAKWLILTTRPGFARRRPATSAHLEDPRRGRIEAGISAGLCYTLAPVGRVADARFRVQTAACANPSRGRLSDDDFADAPHAVEERRARHAGLCRRQSCRAVRARRPCRRRAVDRRLGPLGSRRRQSPPRFVQDLGGKGKGQPDLRPDHLERRQGSVDPDGRGAGQSRARHPRSAHLVRGLAGREVRAGR